MGFEPKDIQKFEDFIEMIISRYPNYRNRITVLGILQNDILHKLYSESNIYIALPYVEGFGFTFLEAMSHGIPVIAPKISPIKENIGDAGLLVDNKFINQSCYHFQKMIHIYSWSSYNSYFQTNGL